MQEDMKDFVTSQSAAGALFTIVLGELCDFSVRVVETAGSRGRPCARLAGSPQRMWPSTRTVLVTGSLLGSAQGGGDRGGEAGTWLAAGRRRACSVPCVSRKHCLGRGWDFCSEYHVSRLHHDVWPRVAARDLVGMLRQLKARGWWKELPPRGRSGAPFVGCWISSHLCWTEPNPSHTTKCLCLLVRMRRLVRYHVKLQEACDAKAKDRGRGVLNEMDVVEKKKWAAKAQKYWSHLA